MSNFRIKVDLGTRQEYEIITNEDDDDEKFLCRFCKTFVKSNVDSNECDYCRLVYCIDCQKKWVNDLNHLGYNVKFDTFLFEKIEESRDCYIDYCPFCVYCSKNEDEPQFKLLSDILNLKEPL